MKTQTRRIVLAGGPCAGKSTIAGVLAHTFADKLVIVPESASTLLSSKFPRWPEHEALRAFQTAIFQVQRNVERAYEAHHGPSIFILDRGSVDGAAYWPDGAAAFFQAQGTTEAAEFGRYERVIYLETANELDYEAHRQENPVRSEGWASAQKLDAATRAVWQRHPNIIFVKAEASFSDKVQVVVELIRNALV